MRELRGTPEWSEGGNSDALPNDSAFFYLTFCSRYVLCPSSRPARGASGGVWLQGGIGERGFGWRQLGLSEAVVLRS